MCSVQDEQNEETLIPIPEKFNLDHCKKCKSENCPIILRKTDAYCENCFLISTIHKFRATLGKSKLIRHGDKVLIAFSGDQPSSILLHLIWDGLAETNFKKLRFHPIILYIDEGAIFNLSKEKREENAKFALKLAEQTGIEIFITSLSEPNKCNLSKNINLNESIDDEIKRLLISTSSLTAKQDLVKKIRNNLLLHCAKELNCSFILTAETATKLAGALLANVTLGGGGHLHSDVGFCDTRNSIRILRPLRDFTSEDVNYFINLKKISFIEHDSLRDEKNPFASIQSLTDKFVNDLQRDFPATISTVLRTGEKLENSEKADAENTCILCQSTLDTTVSSSSALDAIEFSRNISNPSLSNGQDCNSNQGSSTCSGCTCKNNKLTKQDIDEYLCYSCRLSIRDVKDLSLLPNMIKKSAEQRKALSSIKDQIKDYLLE